MQDDFVRCFGLGCSVGMCFVFRVSGCVMDYCICLGRCFVYCGFCWGALFLFSVYAFVVVFVVVFVLLLLLSVLFFLLLFVCMLCYVLCCMLGCGAVLCWGAGGIGLSDTGILGVSGYLILGYRWGCVWGFLCLKTIVFIA